MAVTIGLVGEKQLGVGQLPGRKRPSLYFEGPGWLRPLASFNSEESAKEVQEFLLDMAGKRVASPPKEPHDEH